MTHPLDEGRIDVMPYRLCPVCRVPGRVLKESTKDSTVIYVRCDQCGRVWTQSKADLHAPPTIIAKKPGEV